MIQREQSKLKQQAKERARKLLRRFITPMQWQDYNTLGCFSQKDGKGRLWKFKNTQHYPIECDSTPICIDIERGAPDEDLLLQVWFEVIGGRGEKLLSSKETGGFGFVYGCETIGSSCNYNSTSFAYFCISPEHHGVLHGITT